MNDVSLVQPGLKASGAFFVEMVTWVQHWTDTLFSFRTTRDAALRFSSGLLTRERRSIWSGRRDLGLRRI